MVEPRASLAKTLIYCRVIFGYSGLLLSHFIYLDSSVNALDSIDNYPRYVRIEHCSVEFINPTEFLLDKKTGLL